MESTKAEILSLGVPVFPIRADLRLETGIQALFNKVEELPGQLAVLVNSAALMPKVRFEDMSFEEWDALFALNLRAPWFCAKFAAGLMAQQGGCIINITDAGAGRAWNSYPAYSTSKAALDTMTRILASALAPRVRVNAVAPGLIMRAPEISEEEWNRLLSRLPLKKSGSPEHVQKAIDFILDNEYVTGQTIVVDGGYQLT